MSVADAVNTWAHQKLLTGAIAGHTPSYNQAVAALPALVSAIEAAQPAPAAAPPATLITQAQTDLAALTAALAPHTPTDAA